MIPADLAAEQRKLVEFVTASHPEWFVGVEVTKELIFAFAFIFDRARRAIDHLFDMTFVTRATAGGASDPDWLDGLAREQNDHRLEGETDAALSDRLRTVPAVVTRPQILAAVEAFLAARGVSGPVAIESLPTEAGYCFSTPAVIADAAGYSFMFTPSTSALASRVCSTTPFGFLVIIPATASDAVVASLRTLLDEISAGGYASFVERAA